MLGSQDPGSGLLEAFRFPSCESPAALSQGFCFFGDVVRRRLSPERGTLFLRPRGTGVPLFHFWKGEHHATSQVRIGWRIGKADAAGGCRSPAPVMGETVMTDREAKRAVARALQLAREDPQLVKLLIKQLKATGEVDAGDLNYLEEVADKWIRIAEENRTKGRRV
jgi:hypothetical protein